MDNPNNPQFYKFSQNADYDFFFEDDDFQDYESDRDFNQLLDNEDLDDPDDYFWDEN